MKCPLFVRQYVQVGVLGIILALSIFMKQPVIDALQVTSFGNLTWLWEMQFEVSSFISFIGLLPIILLFLIRFKKERYLLTYAIIWLVMMGLITINIILDRTFTEYSIFGIVSAFYSVIGQISIIGVMMLIFSKTNYSYYVKAGLLLSSLLAVTDESILPLLGNIIFVISMTVLLYELQTHKYIKSV